MSMYNGFLLLLLLWWWWWWWWWWWLNTRIVSWPFATGGISVRYRLQLRASTRRFHSKSYHILFYGHLPGRCNCPVSSGRFATGGISVEISATTTCLREAFPYLRWRYRLQLVASMRSSHSYHTFYGHHPGWCNCPVSSGRFATGGISVEISATTTLPP